MQIAAMLDARLAGIMDEGTTSAKSTEKGEKKAKKEKERRKRERKHDAGGEDGDGPKSCGALKAGGITSVDGGADEKVQDEEDFGGLRLFKRVPKGMPIKLSEGDGSHGLSTCSKA